jgi:AraC-like DNA-binding protein
MIIDSEGRPTLSVRLGPRQTERLTRRPRAVYRIFGRQDVRCTLQLKPAPVVAPDADARRGGNQPGRVHVAGPARYAERAPPPDLVSDIVCFWTMRIDRDAGIFVQHLLPDLTVDIVSLNGGPLFVRGLPTSATQLSLQPGTSLAGARLRAGVARRLLDRSPRDLLDSTALLDTAIRTKLRDTAASSERSVHAAIATLLRRQIAMNDGQADPVVRSAIDWLAGNSRGTLDDLARHVGWSARELRRRFVVSLGVGPKLAQRMLRVQHALRLAHTSEGEVLLSSLALECGFADQSHLTRELRRFAELTPHEMRSMARSAH